MTVRTYRLATIAAALALSSLAACEIHNPAPVVVNPQPNPSVVVQPNPSVVVQPSPQPPAVVVTPQ